MNNQEERAATGTLVVSLRPLIHGDLEQCAAIESACYPANVCEGIATFAAHFAHHPGGCAVAVSNDNSLLGYLLSLPTRFADCPLELSSTEFEEATDRPHDTLFLHDLAIAAHARQQGIAAMLIDLAEAYARSKGLPTITLTAVCGVQKSELSPALSPRPVAPTLWRSPDWSRSDALPAWPLPHTFTCLGTRSFMQLPVPGGRCGASDFWRKRGFVAIRRAARAPHATPSVARSLRQQPGPRHPRHTPWHLTHAVVPIYVLSYHAM